MINANNLIRESKFTDSISVCCEFVRVLGEIVGRRPTIHLIIGLKGPAKGQPYALSALIVYF